MRYSQDPALYSTPWDLQTGLKHGNAFKINNLRNKKALAFDHLCYLFSFDNAHFKTYGHRFKYIGHSYEPYDIDAPAKSQDVVYGRWSCYLLFAAYRSPPIPAQGDIPK